MAFLELHEHHHSRSCPTAFSSWTDNAAVQWRTGGEVDTEFEFAELPSRSYSAFEGQ